MLFRSDGMDALKWWKLYRKTGEPEWLLKIAEYCAYDVKVTRQLHETGVSEGRLRFFDRAGAPQEVKVDWS